MEFTIMLLIFLLLLVISQLAQELMMIFQKLTALTERPQFATKQELMESQILAAHHHFHCAMVFQEPMDTQVLIALLHHSQHVAQFMEEHQVLTAKSDQVLLLKLECHKLNLFKLLSQPALTDTPSTAKLSAMNLKQLDALNLELQLLFH
jgi:hypothetical protein